MSANQTLNTKRLIPLEGFRGIAAIIVLIHHFLLGFSPYTSGLLKAARNAESLVGNWYFFVFNGTAAVSFFFTLSGFVLCWSFFKNENADKLLLSFLKRWPRLMGPVVLTTLMSWLLFQTHGYYFAQAAQYSQSPWLASFAFAGWAPDFHPSLARAFAQGLMTFFSGQVNYNTNLWTMRPEFQGSLVVFLFAGFIVYVLRYRFLAVSCALFVAILATLSLNLVPFVVGIFFSAHMAKRPVNTQSCTLSWVGILIGLYLLGYVEPIGAYRWVSLLMREKFDQSQILLHTLGSMLIIHATVSNESIFLALSNRLCMLLGRLSFSLYLVHTLVICSSSSFVYCFLNRHALHEDQILLITFMATVAVTLAMAVPLMIFDEWWMKYIDLRVRDARDWVSG